jgi:hypothetical protein
MAETTKKATALKKPRATAAKVTAPKATAPKTSAPVKKATRAKVAVMASHEEIAELAHRFWTERGQDHGHHEEDWLRAEQALLGKAS